MSVMDMFIAQTVAMMSQIYAYLTHQVVPLNMYSFVYVNLTSIKYFLKKQ